MGLKQVGKVKIRQLTPNPKSGMPHLMFTIPQAVKIFFTLKVGELVEVYVDEENKRIIYQLP